MSQWSSSAVDIGKKRKRRKEMEKKMTSFSNRVFLVVRAKNTITNVDKLLASADDLVMNGEFEPQDVYAMTKELEQRMDLFLQRVERRKNILDLSVLFHTHVVEVRWTRLDWTVLGHDMVTLMVNWYI